MHRLASIVILFCWTTAALAAERQAVSPQDLLDPSLLPDADMGLRVESAGDGDDARIVTTGGRFEIDKAAGTVVCHQRIGIERRVTTIRLPAGALNGARLTHQSSGAAVVASDAAIIRINGDSLAMIQLKAGGDITAKIAFTPDFHNRFQASFNFFDPMGGVSFFDHGVGTPCTFGAATDPVTVRWKLNPGDVLWAAVSPPRAFDWQQSISMRVAVHGSSIDRFMYPSDIMLHRLKAQGFTVLYLHNEEAWEHWQLSLVPRDRKEYQRVMRTAREIGLKTIVYASPHFFLKGTASETTADPSSHVGRGTFSGQNAREYLSQATRLIKEFETDGLYFDEIYSSPSALATQYWLTRESRKLVGAGPLFFHSTTDVLGDGHTGLVCPPINTYFDVVYKGEGEWTRFDPAYTRYILGTFNTSNAISVQINDERFVPTPQQINFWLRRGNVRFFLYEYMNHNGANRPLVDHYLPRLTSQLQGEIEPALLKPVGAFARFRQSIKEMGN